MTNPNVTPDNTSLPPTHPLARLWSRPKVKYLIGVQGVGGTQQVISASPSYAGVDGLCDCVRSKVLQLMKNCLAQGIELKLIETLRAWDRQEVLWRLRATKTLDSQHEAHPPKSLGLAADLCPVEYLVMKGWNGSGVHWKVMGEEAVGLGLGWGGSWSSFTDKPHVELKACECAQ